MKKPTFGIITLQAKPWEIMIKEWKFIEELDFDHLWIADHFLNYSNLLQPWFEGWTTLSALAALTSRIRIGTLVTSISLRHPQTVIFFHNVLQLLT